MHDILNNRPRPYLPSDPGGPGRRAENSNNYTVWAVRISVHVFRPAPRRADFPTINGRNSEGLRLLLRLHRRHPGVLPHTGGARATPPNILQTATGTRDPAEPQQVCFRATDVTFLGYRISASCSQPLPDRVAHFQACPPPQTIRELWWFLGMLKFYRRFLPHALATEAPLNPLLAGPRTWG